MGLVWPRSDDRQRRLDGVLIAELRWVWLFRSDRAGAAVIWAWLMRSGLGRVRV